MAPSLASVYDMNTQEVVARRHAEAKEDSLNEVVSRRKLIFFAVLGTSMVVPATTLLMATDAEAQQADQTAPADAAPKKKTKKKKGGASTGSAPQAKSKAQ